VWHDIAHGTFEIGGGDASQAAELASRYFAAAACQSGRSFAKGEPVAGGIIPSAGETITRGLCMLGVLEHAPATTTTTNKTSEQRFSFMPCIP
jgi:hypothetical protein